MSVLGRLLKLLKDRPLSDNERRKLGKELNRPLIDNVIAPHCFQSRRRFAASDIGQRALGIEWMSCCGQENEVRTSSIPYVSIKSWEQAKASASAESWNEATTKARAGLESWVRRLRGERKFRYNQLTAEFDTAIVKPHILPAIEEAMERYGLEKNAAVVSGLRRVLSGAYVENAWIETGHSSFFFLELLEWVEAGHCPCGWEGVWPEGKLVVF